MQLISNLIFFSLLILLYSIIGVQSLQSSVVESKSDDPLKIAVIGAGIGGSSFAYFVKELLGERVQLDIYDKGDVVGGRLGTLEVFSNEYETGGSIIHPKNQHAVELTKKLDLRQMDPMDNEKMTLVHDGKEVFSTSRWQISTIVRFLYRYGLQFNKLESMINSFIDSFERIYSLQSDLNSYESPSDLLRAMDPTLLNLTLSSFDKFLLDKGYSPRLVTEIVQACSMVNYGQPIAKLHSFVGSISIAGADSELWSVQGGNRHLVLALLNHTKNAKLHLKTRVNGITSLPTKKYTLQNDKGIHIGKEYDHVVIAFPLEASPALQFNNLPTFPTKNGLKFHRTVATIVCGELNANYSGMGNVISLDEGHWFTSLSRIFPVKLTKAETLPVYKFFSPQPLTQANLDAVFKKILLSRSFDWLAYPDYISGGIPSAYKTSFSPLGLTHNIHYLNAIEWTASAIEMSLISAKNIANRIAGESLVVDGAKVKEEKKKKEEL